MQRQLGERTCTVGELQITVRRADLEQVNGNDCDPYVQLTFDARGEKETHRTPTEAQTKMPAWEEEDSFAIPIYTDVHAAEYASKPNGGGSSESILRSVSSCVAYRLRVDDVSCMNIRTPHRHGTKK